jgi:hypothetical protein
LPHSGVEARKEEFSELKFSEGAVPDMNRIKFFGAVFAFALLILALPTAASAQWRDNDDYYGNNRGNYNRRYLVDAVRRIEDNSRTFRRALDRELDRSRREDRINDVAEQLATAADNLEDSFDNGRNLRSSTDEAQYLLRLGSQIDRFVSRNRFGGNVESQWNSIRRDLQTVANAYNLRFNGNRGGWNNNRRDRDRDDDYDNDDYRRRLPRFPF